jgi:AraC-like DNA-binding protein
MKGAGVRAMYHLIYPEGISAIHVSKELLVYNSFFEKNIQYDVLSSAEASAQLHALLNTLFKCRFDNQERNNNMRYGELINNSISIIQEHFSAPLTIDDILTDIPVSKYHFIRVFKQVMGITPYQYLTNYRINMAKILLVTDDINLRTDVQTTLLMHEIDVITDEIVSELIFPPLVTPMAVITITTTGNAKSIFLNVTNFGYHSIISAIILPMESTRLPLSKISILVTPTIMVHKNLILCFLAL